MSGRGAVMFKINEQIIAFVKQHPVLYDTSHPEFKNTFMKNQLWDQLGEKFNRTGEEVRSKWKNLKDTYSKYLRGQSSESNYRYSKWHWAPDMEFLKDHMPATCDITASSGDVVINSNVEGHAKDKATDKITDQIYQGESSNQSPVWPKIKQKKSNHADKVIWSVNENDVENIPDKCCQDETLNQTTMPPRSKQMKPNHVDRVIWTVNHGTNQLSSTEHIMLGYAKLLDGFSNQRRIETKMKLAQLMMEAELAEEAERTRRQNYIVGNYATDPFVEVQAETEDIRPETVQIQTETHVFKVEEDLE